MGDWGDFEELQSIAQFAQHFWQTVYMLSVKPIDIVSPIAKNDLQSGFGVSVSLVFTKITRKSVRKEGNT
jgi:hypothetical protein